MAVRHTSSQRRKAIASPPLDCYLDSWRVLSLTTTSDQAGASDSSAREESEESESIDQVGDLPVNDYSNSEIDSDEESSAQSAQTSVVESGSGLVDEGITIAIDRQATVPRDKTSKSLGQNQHKRKRSDDGDTGMFSVALTQFGESTLTVVDKAIIEDSNGKGKVRRSTLRKAVSVPSYLECENLWMNETSRVIERSIKDFRGVISLLDAGKPVDEVGGNNTETSFTEIGKFLEGQEQLLVDLHQYIRSCGVKESKITERWKRAK